MARTLRKSTQTKTKASEATARDAGFVGKPRALPPRRKRYTGRKPPVSMISMETHKKLQAKTIANSTQSPLLRLPPEIRAMVFRYALTTSKYLDWVALFYNCHGRTTRYRKYVYLCPGEDIAVALLRVCRQTHSETVSMLYAENTFAFASGRLMHQWLGKRLTAQRGAIRRLVIPCREMARAGAKKSIEAEVRKKCPNFQEMGEDKWLDEWLRREHQVPDFETDEELMAWMRTENALGFKF
ncbi:hypothetical protein P153DRAFT_173074 [Dothidotthia symphoricarpi CBS 119687]|uniref:DUF7730 domain-containing protein n=1 Tax=Dothidotthia symphoricarpi CBS 119687 TaxID=1392245 RepID=A0A6A6ANY9_9PLEO|nr:uncharacterized protein P153DRAFT_173074 [Dothidotthia symphoricarpi CBS 119687]KAF2132765.1 hypothetical protein P153DRAFT_173074 [Dothidotthia symphoricarpi CBS 119687]